MAWWWEFTSTHSPAAGDGWEPSRKKWSSISARACEWGWSKELQDSPLLVLSQPMYVPPPRRQSAMNAARSLFGFARKIGLHRTGIARRGDVHIPSRIFLQGRGDPEERGRKRELRHLPSKRNGPTRHGEIRGSAPFLRGLKEAAPPDAVILAVFPPRRDELLPAPGCKQAGLR